ncbi:tRNA threonylcarbamoyladenosine biosynthesis protein TsaE [Paenibacillus sp. Root52]|uniref:tRNA (adenosine(37)-N6)-threonylcarbamoyltransferase complex ATPase subunit type 1 TsaE n=1 Tax=Paenibacillus sp. Root52 TaxID=1736552 RepID=UPI0006FC210D|nr:tRNA (adenosine(37)-N6)-threonylcarbamoyltransferase complex ATPase subunit type 1 TsaE [Paenibacillus sp. Root52]KQY91692.1 tRNA threonylcarbamoyladenosine biosynthesis protein TsaE [Paenibacillus sp. Root52]
MNQEHEQWVYDSHGISDTEALASALAGQAMAGMVIALDGDLGAGKTAFSQKFAWHLGVRGVVNSPTFTLIKEYEGRLPLYHMDVYRISLEEADELGLDEYFYGTGVSLVEWSSIIPELLPEEHLHIQIETTGPEDRKITLDGYGEKYSAICRQFRQNGV